MGLLSYNLLTKKKAESFFTDKIINEITLSSNHKLFCSSVNPELLFVDLHTGLTGSYTPNPNKIGTISNSRILTMMEDFSGNLWIGHQGLGISILNLYQKEFYTFSQNPLSSNTLSSNTIISFNETQNEYLIGCRSNGLNIIKKSEIEKTIPEIQSVRFPENVFTSSNGIWDIKKEREDKFWLATDVGLFLLQKINTQWKIEPFKGQPAITELVWKVFIDDNKNIWCGTFDGGVILIPNVERNKDLTYFRYKSIVNNENSLTDNNVTEFFLDSKNRFWIGTLNGLNCLKESYQELNLSGNEKPELKFDRFIAGKLTDSTLNNNEINCIYENYDGKIWISTTGGGINIYHPEKKKFEFLTRADGLPSNDVFGIIPDEQGKLWMSTTNGLACYNQLNSDQTITVYDRFDGIQGELFMKNAYFKASNGAILLEAKMDLLIFYPKK